MPHLTLQIISGGPLIDVAVGVSSARREILLKTGQTVPAAVTIRALIDTGATSSCIDHSCLEPLLIPPTGTTSAHTPSTAGKPHRFEQYDVSLTVRHPDSNLFLPNVAVIAAHLPTQGIQALIGRDVLRQCLFVYNGSEETFTLAF
jgi:hypothetical protein